MTHKSKAFNNFIQYKSFVEKQINYIIKILRLDRGGEYIFNKINDCRQKEGIKRELTTTYTPQQNGVLEGKNRTLISNSSHVILF